MKLTLLGATGTTGRSLLEQALERGHHVTVVVRNPARLTIQHSNLKVFEGDVYSASTLVEPLLQSDVVVSCVGVSNPLQARRGTSIYSVGTTNIVTAMRQSNAMRIIVVSSAGVAPRKGAPLPYKLIVKPLFLEPAYRDMRLMENFIQETELDWTIVRPPYLTAAPLRTDYRLMPDHNFDDDRPLSRSSLAHFLLTEAESPRFAKRIVAISG